MGILFSFIRISRKQTFDFPIGFEGQKKNHDPQS